MKWHSFSLILWSTLIVAMLVSVGCSQPATASASPEQVVHGFYRWYLGYPGNVMVDRAYRDSEYLSQELKAEADAILDSFSMGGYDPFLMAQDIPAEMVVGNVEVDGGWAVAMVEQKWPGGVSRELTVKLEQIDGQWLIDKILPPDMDASVTAPPPQMPVAASPERVVRDFYGWYLDYIGGGGVFRNPLVDGAFRSTGYLTERFVREVDELLTSFDYGGCDPFLCAQDVPASFSVGEAAVEDGRAAVTVATSFQNHQFAVELRYLDGRWLIDAVHCLSGAGDKADAADPAAIVRSFYGDYVAYIGDREDPSNPLVDGAYRQSAYLAPELITQVDELVASFESGGYDPFLCAQDILDSITVGEPRLSGNSATVSVSTSFPGHGFDVVLTMAQGGWKIAAIDCTGVAQAPSVTEPAAAPAENAAVPVGWQILQDEAYGFEIWYPADWSVVEIPLRNPELDAPMVRVVQILPSEWAAKMNLGGPPDPNSNVVAPLGLEVSVGSLEEYRRAYYEMPLTQQMEINGTAVILEQDEPGDYQMSRYVFQHPVNGDLRVTLLDMISGFTDRAAGNESIIETTNQIIATFSFTD